MKIKWLLLFLGAILVLVLLGGCNLGTPVCPGGSLTFVNLGAPQEGVILNSLTPVLSWSYPNASCHPESYYVHLTSLENIPQDWSGATGSPSTTWSPASPLKSGREYEWYIQPVNGTYFGPESPHKHFFTGPMCATTSLHAPTLILPGEGDVIHTLTPMLLWQYPDPCLPQGYRVDLSTDPTFTDTSLSGGTGNPAVFWGPGTDLADCTTYYWRIAPINDTTLGPFSDVNFFSTDQVYGCAPQTNATIRGALWYDQCPLPLDTNPVPGTLPVGCIVDSYGVDADGIHQPGEPSLLGVTINLGPGDCPLSGPKSTITDVNGFYQFSNLIPGKYCINVNAASFVGPAGTGHWTLVPGGHEGNTYRSVMVTSGEVLSGQDFAWYNYSGPTPTPFGGSSPTPTPVSSFTPTPVPGYFFMPSINVNCHIGPGLFFDTLDVAMKGMSYPIDGRNAENTWFRIMLNPNRGCWVLESTGLASGDLSRLRVLLSPPTPTPTAVVDCTTYKDQKSCEAQPMCQWKQSTLVTAVTYYCTTK